MLKSTKFLSWSSGMKSSRGVNLHFRLQPWPALHEIACMQKYAVRVHVGKPVGEGRRRMRGPEEGGGPAPETSTAAARSMDAIASNGTGRAYEDFVPPHEMAREPPAHTLSVDLSAAGYKKEHVRVQVVRGHRRLVVRGERPLDAAGSRWSRFRLEFRVPGDCDMSGIHARFDSGVARVVVPGLKAEPVVHSGDGKQELPSVAAKTDVVAGDAGKEDDDAGRLEGPGSGGGGVGREEDAAASPWRGGYGFLPDRRKLATTVVGLGMVLGMVIIAIRFGSEHMV